MEAAARTSLPITRSTKSQPVSFHHQASSAPHPRSRSLVDIALSGKGSARSPFASARIVVIADILEQEGRTLAKELGDHAIFSRLDVTNDKDWAATVAAAEDAFGPVSMLINNAGIARFGVIEETEPAAWRQVIDVNLTGTYLGIRAVVPSMRKAGGGAIVNIASIEAMKSEFGIGAYVASKWGVRGMTKTAASSDATTSASIPSTPELSAPR